MTNLESTPPIGSHLSIDIQTTGRKPGCSILSIGAVKFDPTGRQELHHLQSHQFYTPISMFDNGNYGFSAEPDTMRFWKRKEIYPQLAAECAATQTTLRQALKDLKEFIDRMSPDKIWTNSPRVKFEILEHAYKTVDIPFPIRYRKEMCSRTVMELCYPDRNLRPARSGISKQWLPHHALGEAFAQADDLIQSMRLLNLNLDALARPQQDPVDMDPPAPRASVSGARRGPR